MAYPKFKVGPTKRFTKYVAGDIVADNQGKQFKIIGIDAKGNRYYTLNIAEGIEFWVSMYDFNAITNFVDRSNETI